LTSIAIQFSQDVSASLEVADLSIHNDSTDLDVALSGAVLTYDAQTNTATWDLSAVAIERGNHTIALSAEGVTNSSGVPLGGDGADDYRTPLLVALDGDANLDGAVNRADFLVLKEYFGQVGTGWAIADFNYDGFINWSDYAAMKANAGRVLAHAPSGPLGGESPAGASTGEQIAVATRAVVEPVEALKAEAPAGSGAGGGEDPALLSAAEEAWYEGRSADGTAPEAREGDALAAAAVANPADAQALLPAPPPSMESHDTLAGPPQGMEVPAADASPGAAALDAGLIDLLAGRRLMMPLTA
jgi:hypothetical protein